MFNFFKKKEPVPDQPKRSSAFTTSPLDSDVSKVEALGNTFQRSAMSDAERGTGMDSAPSINQEMGYQFGAMPDAQLMWYGAQGFIGHQACAMIAQHWLVDKACTVPAKDAIRKGWEVTVNDGTDVPPETLDKIRELDKKYKIKQNLVEFEKMGRVFGIRVAMFKVLSTDPEYYEKPFNADGITSGSYKGISQIDPYWMAPELTGASVSDPSSLDFYQPTYWIINGVRIHKSHLIIMRTSEVPDILKPTYLYGGIPIPQKIYERVYASERTANEAPQLVLTKRTNIYKTDAAEAMSNKAVFNRKMEEIAHYRDNYGIRVIDKERDDVVQFDTALGDLDAAIMTQYQLCASIANVPATKLLGTTPKGFNSTGEYEEASYREELESIQEYDLTPLLNRHYEILIRSEIAPKNPFNIEVSWNPLDSLTEIEQADVNLKKSQTDQALQAAGAIDGTDIRKRITADKDSGYNGLEEIEDDLLNGII